MILDSQKQFEIISLIKPFHKINFDDTIFFKVYTLEIKSLKTVKFMITLQKYIRK